MTGRRTPSTWTLLVLGVSGLVILPVALVAAEVFTPTPDVWRHLWRTRLPGMLTSTGSLLALVGVGTVALGLALAWVISAYSFPGRRIFRFALVLPLAMPGYVLGYVFMTTFSFAGPVQSTLRDIFGDDVWFPEVRTLLGASVVLTLTLYPYVYVLAMTALREQGLRTWQVARTLGLGRLQAARRAVLPAARPTVAAAFALVMMEVLTDFATVQYFNVDTVSVGIYRVWKGLGDRPAATELASLVLVFALLVIAAERLLRGRARFYQQGAKGFLEPIPLYGWKRWGATGACLTVLSAAFLLPVWRLVTWTNFGDVASAEYVRHLSRTATLAGLAAVSCLAVAALVTTASRLGGGKATRWAARGLLVGYTLPGTVIAIGVLLAFNGAGRVVYATTTIWGVLYAYVVRFVPLSTVTLDASLEKMTPSVVMAARTLGARPARVLARIQIPMLRSGMTAALLLVFVHTLSELPIVLLLRPFKFDTLSVWIWDLTANSAWEQTGLPALTIVAAALVPVILMVRAGDNARSGFSWEKAIGEPSPIQSTGPAAAAAAVPAGVPVTMGTAP